jgi:hypothetical protein
MPVIIPARADELFQCHPNPPDQGPVGRKADLYLQIYQGGKTGLSPDQVSKKLTRVEVRKICRNPDIPVLEAYCTAMSWGVQNLTHFRTSISKDDGSRSRLEGLLAELRASRATRMEDFNKTQQACASIKGLGISFFTKLLFFFRPSEDAYILDQHTAKSAHLLFEHSPVLVRNHMPHPETDGSQYADFCEALENLGLHGGRQWTGESVERAIFDKPRGKWRRHVETVFPRPQRVAARGRRGC